MKKTMARPSKILTKEDLQRAMSQTRSNRAAARYLHVSYNHYKKYAKMYKTEDGITFLEAHMNQSGKGIPKFLTGKGKVPPLMDVIEGRVSPTHFTPKKIKERLIFEAILEEKCARCDFSERRVVDNRVPLILHHKNKNKKDFNLDNIELLCYNCSFLYGVAPITDDQVEKMEDYIETHGKDFDWELDEHHIEHLKELGLYEEENPGEEYISRL